jgi:hypothetical protein
MACSQALSGIAASCDTNTGGIREVYICNYDDLVSYEVDSTSNMIDTITMDTDKKFKKYLFKKNTSNLTSTLNVDPAQGINFVQSDLTMVFAKQETTKRMEIAKLSLGELRVIVLDANGKYWFLGAEEFVAATAATAQTGTNRTDGNNYTITLTDYSASYPYEVDPAIIDNIVA